MKTKIILILTGFLLLMVGICHVQTDRLKKAQIEAQRQQKNVEVLMTEANTYRTRDSLSAAKAETLELRLKEFEQYRAEDAELIKSLKTKNRELESINETQAATIIDISTKPKDTVIVVRDSVVVPAVKVHSGDAWYDFDGILAEGKFSGTLVSRDSLVVVETIKRKKFLFWKTKRIKNRQVDVVAKNPHTTILSVEQIKIIE